MASRHRDLPPPRHGAGQQHAHDVRAGHQHNDPDREHQARRCHVHRAAHLRRQSHVVRQRQRRTLVLVRFRIGSFQIGHDHVQVRRRLRQRDAVAKTSLDEHPAEPAALELRLARRRHPGRDAHGRQVGDPGHRDPQVRAGNRRHAVELRRRHPDDDVGDGADVDGPSDHVGIPTERALPQTAGDHHHAWGRGAIVLRRQEPAPDGPQAQELEVVAGDCLAHDEARGLVHARDGRHRGVRGHLGEDLVLCSQVQVVRIGARRVRIVGQARPDVDELRRSRDGQRMKERGIDDREDGRVEADRDGEGHDGGEREDRAASRRTDRIGEVADQILDRTRPTRVANRFPDCLGAAQPHLRPPLRLPRRQARAQVLLLFHLQVEAQLQLRLGVLAPPPEQLPEPRGQLAERPHSVPPAQFSTPFTPLTVRSQAARSRSSCSRPASVSA